MSLSSGPCVYELSPLFNVVISSVYMSYLPLTSFITALGVTCLVLCEASYPAILAFSCLSEVEKEFIKTYDREKLEAVVRPYACIDFGTYIKQGQNAKLKQLFGSDYITIKFRYGR
jgi:hypothetical protein